MLRRYELTDTEWNNIKDFLPPEKTGKPGRATAGNCGNGRKNRRGKRH